MLRIVVLSLIALFAAPGCRPIFSRSASNPQPQDPQAEELTHDQISVWSLTYSANGALLLSSHVSQSPSGARSCGLAASAEHELWAVGHSLGKPDGCLAKFQSPDWRWLPFDNRFSPDGRFAFSTSGYGLLQWDVAQQRLAVKFSGRHVVLSPDCRTAICEPQTAGVHDVPGAEDAPLELWDVAQERKIDVLPIERSIGRLIEFLPEGQRLLAWAVGPDGKSAGSSPLVIWDLRTKTTTGLKLADPSRRAIALSSDGRRLAAETGSPPRVQVVETATGEPIAAVPSWDKAIAIALSTDGSLVAMVGESSEAEKTRGEIQIWRVYSGKRQARFVDADTWGITAVCFSPDGRTLTTGDAKGVIKRWPLESPQPK